MSNPRHADLASSDGGRSICTGSLERPPHNNTSNNPHPRRRRTRKPPAWRCTACKATITMTFDGRAVWMDTSRRETWIHDQAQSLDLPQGG